MASILTVSFLLLALSTQTFSEGTPNPVLLWSNTNTFAHQNNRKIEISTAQGLNDLIYHPLSQYFQHDAIKPEVVIIFAENTLTWEELPLEKNSFELKSNGGSFPHLMEIVNTSHSSIVFPSVPKGQSISIQTIAHLSNSISGNTYIVEDPDPTKLSFIAEKGVILSKLQELTDSIKISSMHSQQLLNDLKNNAWAPLTNGLIDLIVVGFQNQINSPSKLAADDSKIKSIVDALGEVQYSSFFVTDVAQRNLHARSEQDEEVYSHLRSAPHFKIRGDMDDWSDDVLEALILMAPFIGIVLLGVICTCKLQSDLKFDHERNILKKQ